MRVYLKTTCAGPEGSFAGEREYAVPGQIPEHLARELLAGGYADLRGEPAPDAEPAAAPEVPEVVETATQEPPPENAAGRTTRPKGRRGRR